MTPTALRALAARVLAEEPSDELRDAVLIALGWNTDCKGVWWQPRRHLSTRTPPNPLTSHDAAFAAMPAGCRVRSGWIDDELFYAFARHAIQGNSVHALAPTLPRALTAAGLLARAVDAEQGDGGG